MVHKKYLVQKIDGRELKENDFETIRTVGFMTFGCEVVVMEEREPKYSVHYISNLESVVKTCEKRKSKHPIITMEIFGKEEEKIEETKTLLKNKLKVELELYEY